MDLTLLEKSKSGDIEARNAFIEINKPFVHKYASAICKRYLHWENDDELSIALLAFNDSIDSFKEGNFEAYSKVVIKNKLIDFFRKNSKNEVPLEDEIVEKVTAYTNSIDDKLDRAMQINLFRNIIKEFKITFEDLTVKSPKHKDTRDKLVNLAIDISKRKDVLAVITNKKILPTKEIILFSGLSRKVLEEWRKYLIALIIIFSDNRLDSLRDFIL